MGDISVHFNRSEFACSCGCGFDTVDVELIGCLQTLRNHFNSPVTINSACRCPSYNVTVGGALNSQHPLGRAADIVVKKFQPSVVQDYLKVAHPGKFGIGVYDTFTHFDTRTNGPARW